MGILSVSAIRVEMDLVGVRRDGISWDRIGGIEWDRIVCGGLRKAGIGGDGIWWGRMEWMGQGGMGRDGTARTRLRRIDLNREWVSWMDGWVIQYWAEGLLANF
jgi:hypothetical protein